MSSTKIRCGTQCLFCDYPIHFDTYYGCSHNCRYCFANNKKQLSNIRPQNQYNNVKRFIEGKRTVETNFCDWNIPLHWGANSDPFQKCEYEYKKSFEILEKAAKDPVMQEKLNNHCCISYPVPSSIVPFPFSVTGCGINYREEYNRDCKYYDEEHDMGATIPICTKYDKFGDFNCNECYKYKR